MGELVGGVDAKALSIISRWLFFFVLGWGLEYEKRRLLVPILVRARVGWRIAESDIADSLSDSDVLILKIRDRPISRNGAGVPAYHVLGRVVS